MKLFNISWQVTLEVAWYIIGKQELSNFPTAVIKKASVTLKAVPSHLADINANIIFIVGSVAHSQPKFVLAVQSMQIHFLGKENHIPNERLMSICVPSM